MLVKGAARGLDIFFANILFLAILVFDVGSGVIAFTGELIPSPHARGL
jgi:hypothetical protein